MSGMTRRDFIKIVSVSGAGLVLAGYINPVFRGNKIAEEFSPSVYFSIDSSGVITVTYHRSEMGQGSKTSLPMIVADELDADWKDVKIIQAQAHQTKYGSQSTGGSTSVRIFYETLRTAGATARLMLIKAAAEKWNTSESNCYTENCYVINKAGEQKLSYGELAEAASKIPVPENVKLKDPSEFKFIGTKEIIRRVDSEEKITGKPVFGYDFVLPGMVYAAVIHSPVYGGKLLSYDSSEAMKIDGVAEVFDFENRIVVIANNTYAAFSGKEKITARWDDTENSGLSSEGIRQYFEEKSGEQEKIYKDEGNFELEYDNAELKLDAVYEMQFLSHAPMEPLNCVADVRADSAELWISTQSAQNAQKFVAQELGLPVEAVTVNILYSGGGFGRRLFWDYPVEAAAISKKTGKPVFLCYTRKDDMHSDRFRPASLHKLSAGIKNNSLVALKHKIISPSITKQLNPASNQEIPDAVDGTLKPEYAFPNYKVEYVMANTAVPILWWRAVYNTQNPIASECFLDEIAGALKKDPFEFKRDLLPADSRKRYVLEKVAEISDWKNPLPAGWGKGIACHFCFGSFAATVVYASALNNKIKIEKVFSVVDCGQVVNRNSATSQIEGGIIFGLSAAMKSKITIDKGRVVQSNFDGYEVLLYDETPEITVYIKDSNDAPGGIGEPPVPPAIAACVSAVSDTVGKRIRKLPILNK